MIVSVLLRMKYDDITKIDAGINWILKYQNVGRNSSNNWTGSRIQKYGFFTTVEKAVQSSGQWTKGIGGAMLPGELSEFQSYLTGCRTN